MISATGLVLMMTLPGLALFYAGMVRKKNVLATMAQSLAAVMICSILWVAIGYSLAFTGEGAYIGTTRARVSVRHGDGRRKPAGQDDPGSIVHALPDDLRDHHGCAGRRIGRRPHAAFPHSCWFSILWLLVVYVPLAHWVWGGGFLGAAGVLDFAGGTVVHLNAGVAGLVAAYVLGVRRGYGTGESRAV